MRLLIARSSLTVVMAAALVVVAELSGCAATPPPATTQSIADRQDQAINDPMDYKIPPPRSVDGGSTGTLDRKGMGLDFNDLINP